MAIYQKVRYTDRNESGIDERLSDRMSGCTLCPRMCGADRENGKTGFCGETGEIRAARAALHMWEEPCISGKEGSGTVFFTGCTLRCVFCQNHEIAGSKVGKVISEERLAEIFLELQGKGANNINLVTPTHYAPHIHRALEIARRSRGTPRLANRMLKRVRDWAQVRGDGVIDEDVAAQALSFFEVDNLGLDAVDNRILELLAVQFGGRPVGLTTLASALSEDTDTIEDVYEPYLMQQGLIVRTPKGRQATERAYEHLGIVPPKAD